MEGAARLLQAYEMKKHCVMCCRHKVGEKMFEECWLQCDEAINPSLIMWQNLGYSKKERFFRIIFTSLISLVLIIITMFVVLGQSALNTSINAISP